MSVDDVIGIAESPTPGQVMKAPWTYYGKIIKLAGTVGIVQEYPPDSAEAKAAGGELSEIVFVTNDRTFIDHLHLGSTGNLTVGDNVTIYGFPVGIVDAKNKLGGTTQELTTVGKIVQ